MWRVMSLSSRNRFNLSVPKIQSRRAYVLHKKNEVRKKHYKPHFRDLVRTHFMPVRRAECAWAPCELRTPRQYVYVKIANRCMVPWCTQDASAFKDVPRTGALKIRRGPVIEPDSGESPRFDPWLLARFVMMLIGRPLTRFFRPCVLSSPTLG